VVAQPEEQGVETEPMALGPVEAIAMKVEDNGVLLRQSLHLKHVSKREIKYLISLSLGITYELRSEKRIWNCVL
jgi:hypothetical protein